MARLIPNPVGEINHKIDGIVAKVEVTLGQADNALGNVGATLREVEALLIDLRERMELLDSIPEIARQIEEIHKATVKAAPKTKSTPKK